MFIQREQVIPHEKLVLAAVLGSNGLDREILSVNTKSFMMDKGENRVTCYGRSMSL